MDGLTEILTLDYCTGDVGHHAFRGILPCQPKVNSKAGLVYEKTEQGQIQVKKPLRTAVQDVKQFVLIVFKIGRGPVCGHDGPLMLHHPRDRIVNLRFRYRVTVSTVFMHNRKRQ